MPFAYRSANEHRFQATMILAFSQDRLEHMIGSICHSWQGPITAAVHLPLMAADTTATEITAEASQTLAHLGQW